LYENLYILSGITFFPSFFSIASWFENRRRYFPLNCKCQCLFLSMYFYIAMQHQLIFQCFLMWYKHLILLFCSLEYIGFENEIGKKKLKICSVERCLHRWFLFFKTVWNFTATSKFHKLYVFTFIYTFNLMFSLNWCNFFLKQKICCRKLL
jgi:hypothetical protein